MGELPWQFRRAMGFFHSNLLADQDNDFPAIAYDRGV